jgi:hypothetical protein
MPASLLLLVVVLMVWALVEVAQADRDQVRTLSKPVWIVLIVLLSPVAALAWFIFGRPAREGVPATSRPQRPAAPWANRSTRTVARPAPDDDPEFLASLKRQAERERRAREQEQQRNQTSEPDGDPDRRD